MKSILLAGDIGGTHTRLAAFARGERGLQPLTEASYLSRKYKGLEPILAEFIKGLPRGLAAAAFGVAGPVSNGLSKTTNLPWVVDVRSVASALKIPKTELLNDLVAHAYGIAALKDSDVAVLQPGTPGARGNILLLAAGTGLGEAHLYWDGSTHHPSPSEGGHVDFAPRDELQMELLGSLRVKDRHVSYEQVLSGPGLYNIYRFLKNRKRGQESPELAEKLRQKDPSAVISEEALAGRSPLCAKSLDLFVHIYGAYAGNAALSVWALGGVYIGGGIAPKILAKLKGGSFMRAFLAKGRLSESLSRIPVKVILNDKTALWGAALYAARNVGRNSGKKKRCP